MRFIVVCTMMETFVSSVFIEISVLILPSFVLTNKLQPSTIENVKFV